MTTPPAIKTSLTDFPRAIRETGQLAFQFRKLKSTAPKGNGAVMCISGYGAGDGSMYPMRNFLASLGYDALKADIGINIESRHERIMSVDDALRFRHKMADLLQERVEDLYKNRSEKIALIGWSMGGLFATDVSQRIPDKVSRVITLGTPFGDPRGTSTFKILRTLNRSNVPIESQDFASWMKLCDIAHDDVPISVIFSPNDGIVSTDCAWLSDHPAVEHIEVDSSHVGFATNMQAYHKIAEILAG